MIFSSRVTATFLGLLLISSSSFAQSSFEVGRNTKLHVQCSQAQVKLQGTGGSSVSVSSNSTKLTVRKDPLEDIIKVECEGSDPKLSITVQGASVASKINVRSGSLNIQDWNAEVHALLEKGAITSKKTNGPLKLFMTNGQIDVQGHQGKIKSEGFNIKLSVTNVEGPAELSNFMGTTVAKDIKGDLSVNSRNGTVTADNISGTMKYETDNGKLDLAQIGGSIEGESDQAQVTIRLTNPARLKAKVKNGTYKIMVPSSSGAQVYMAFEEGQFQVPSFLKTDSYGTTKTVRGSLRGGESGRVSLSGDSARVTLQTF